MRGKHNRLPVIRNFIQLLDKHRTFGFQGIHNKFIMHDFMTHIDGRAVFLQRAFHDLDGSIHSRTKPAGCGQ